MQEHATMTPSTEDYLETIYRLSELGTIGVRSIDVATQLNVARPSVNRALRSLSEGGWIHQEPYALIYLSASGIKQAEDIFTRHRTLQRFLRDVLGVVEPIAEDDACRMEHVISAQTMAALCKFMDAYPTP